MASRQRRHRSSGESGSAGASRRGVAQRRQARPDPSRSPPRRKRLRQTPHQGRGPSAGQSAPASRTRRCLSRRGEDGARRGRASGDSRRLGRQRARAQAAHPQSRSAGEGAGDFGLRRSASDALVQQCQDSPAIPAPIALHRARGLSAHRGDRRGIPRAVVSRCRGLGMGLGRADSQPHQILATGNGTLVLHPFAVPTGHRAGAPHWLAVSVAPAPVLGPAVSGARVARSPGPASQVPNSSCEVSTDVPNPVAARHLAASSSQGRHPHQAYLRSTHADRQLPDMEPSKS